MLKARIVMISMTVSGAAFAAHGESTELRESLRTSSQIQNATGAGSTPVCAAHVCSTLVADHA